MRIYVNQPLRVVPVIDIFQSGWSKGDLYNSNLRGATLRGENLQETRGLCHRELQEKFGKTKHMNLPN